MSSSNTTRRPGQRPTRPAPVRRPVAPVVPEPEEAYEEEETFLDEDFSEEEDFGDEDDTEDEDEDEDEEVYVAAAPRTPVRRPSVPSVRAAASVKPFTYRPEPVTTLVETPAEDEVVEEYTADSYLQARLIKLPSGKGVRIRPVSILALLDEGSVPNALAPAIRRFVYGDEKQKAVPAPRNRAEARAQGQRSRAEAEAAAEEETRDDGKDMLKVIDHIVMALVVSFRVVDCAPGDEGPGEVSVRSMYETDKVAIAEYALKGQRALTSFRR